MSDDERDQQEALVAELRAKAEKTQTDLDGIRGRLQIAMFELGKIDGRKKATDELEE